MQSGPERQAAGAVLPGAGVDPLVRRAVRYPALQDEPLVAIAAIDIAFRPDLQPDARMAERRRNLRGAVAGDAGLVGVGDLGGEGIGGHDAALAKDNLLR